MREKIAEWMEKNGHGDREYHIKNELVFVMDDNGEVIEVEDLADILKKL